MAGVVVAVAVGVDVVFVAVGCCFRLSLFGCRCCCWWCPLKLRVLVAGVVVALLFVDVGVVVAVVLPSQLPCSLLLLLFVVVMDASLFLLLLFVCVVG